MNPLEHLLQGLRQAGRVDSAGGFTLAPEAALAKLRDSLLGDPHRAALKLIQAAVAFGHGRLELQTGRQFQVRFERELAVPGRVEDPFQLLVPGQTSTRGFRHLAIGTVGLLKLCQGSLELPFQDADGLKTLRISRDEIQLTPREGTVPFTVDLARDAQSAIINHLPSAQLAPLDLKLPKRGQRPVAEAEVAGDPTWGTLRLREASQVTTTRIEQPQAIVGYTLDQQRGQLYAVQDGVILERIDLLDGQSVLARGQVAYLSVDDLPTNLAGFQLLDTPQIDQELERRLVPLRQALLDLRDVMATRFDELPLRWDVARAFLTRRYGDMLRYLHSRNSSNEAQ